MEIELSGYGNDGIYWDYEISLDAGQHRAQLLAHITALEERGCYGIMAIGETNDVLYDDGALTAEGKGQLR